MLKKRRGILNPVDIVFSLLLIGTLIFGGLWYYFSSLEWQNDDPQIGYVIDFIYLCYFIFFMIVGEVVLWRNIAYFTTLTKGALIERICRVMLIVASCVELVGAVCALYIEELTYSDLLAFTMVCISIVQLLCQCVIWIARFVTSRKRSTTA